MRNGVKCGTSESEFVSILNLNLLDIKWTCMVMKLFGPSCSINSVQRTILI